MPSHHKKKRLSWSAFWSFVELEQVGFKHRPIDLTRLLRYDSRSVPAGGEFFFGLGTQTRPETLSVGAAELLNLPYVNSQNPHPKSLYTIFSRKMGLYTISPQPPPPHQGGGYLLNEWKLENRYISLGFRKFLVYKPYACSCVLLFGPEKVYKTKQKHQIATKPKNLTFSRFVVYN